MSNILASELSSEFSRWAEGQGVVRIFTYMRSTNEPENANRFFSLAEACMSNPEFLTPTLTIQSHSNSVPRPTGLLQGAVSLQFEDYTMPRDMDAVIIYKTAWGMERAQLRYRPA